MEGHFFAWWRQASSWWLVGSVYGYRAQIQLRRGRGGAARGWCMAVKGMRGRHERFLDCWGLCGSLAWHGMAWHGREVVLAEARRAPRPTWCAGMPGRRSRSACCGSGLHRQWGCFSIFPETRMPGQRPWDATVALVRPERCPRQCAADRWRTVCTSDGDVFYVLPEKGKPGRR
jgi:hypothetical protein